MKTLYALIVFLFSATVNQTNSVIEYDYNSLYFGPYLTLEQCELEKIVVLEHLKISLENKNLDLDNHFIYCIELNKKSL